jgi:two-component system response regulator LytT
MRVLIIEDEQPASRKLARLLHEIDETIEVSGILESVEATTNWLINNPHPELIFMDIQLEDGLCFEIFENIELKTPVIFTTAYNEYSLKAFKVNSVDYLLKHIDLGELKGAIDKFRTVHQKGIDLLKIETLLSQIQPRTKERFLIKIGEHYRSVQVSNINCFYIRERCNFINVDNDRNYAIDYSLDKVEKMVDPRKFFRANRNFIINFAAILDIVAYSANKLKVSLANWTDKEEILISRDRVADFKKWMDR